MLISNAHTHTFNGPFYGTIWVSRYQKGKTNLDFTEVVAPCKCVAVIFRWELWEAYVDCFPRLLAGFNDTSV